MNNHHENTKTMRALIATISLGLFAMGAPIAADAGTTVYVNARAPVGGNGQDWAHAYTSLQDGLAAAAQTSGAHQIWVATGTYRPGTNPNASFKVTDQTLIYGGFFGTETSLSQRNIAANPTTLSGDLAGNDIADRNDPGYATSRADNAFHVVTIEDSATVTLDGLTISGGSAHGSLADDPYSGTAGGVYVSSGGYQGVGNDFGTAYLTLRNVTISHNDALGRPGRVGFAGGLWQLAGSLIIDQSMFDDNFAPDAAGAFLAGDFSVNSVMDSVVITDSSFTSNLTNSLYHGYGMMVVIAKGFDIERNTFSNNVGREAILQIGYRRGNTLGKALFASNLFDGNRASWFAGAIQIVNSGPPASAGYPIFTLDGNTFAHNASANFGGAVFISGRGDVRLSHNTFTQNMAGFGGGAIYVDGATGSILIQDCQFVQNTVTGTPPTHDFLNDQAHAGIFFSPAGQLGGGAIAIDDGSTNVQIEDSMFNHNSAPFGGAISVVGYSYFIPKDPDFPGWDYKRQGLPDFSQLTVETTTLAAATVSNSRFVKNKATSGSGPAIFSGPYMAPAVPFAGGIFPALPEAGPTSVIESGNTYNP